MGLPAFGGFSGGLGSPETVKLKASGLKMSLGRSSVGVEPV